MNKFSTLDVLVTSGLTKLHKENAYEQIRKPVENLKNKLTVIHKVLRTKRNEEFKIEKK